MLDIPQILQNAQDPDDNYVLPCTLRQLGVRAWELKHDISGEWPDAMRRGWLWASRAQSLADASAYLVSQGEQVSL